MRHNGQDKQDVYKRDILRDYALASAELSAQFDRFEESGVLSYAILRGLLGEAHSKGLLWQLKDTAHHLFDLGNGTSRAGEHLDWAIGFLFHECIIIQEAGYQMQKYYPAAQDFMRNRDNLPDRPPAGSNPAGSNPTGSNPARADLSGKADLEEMRQGLRRLAIETQDSLARGIGRVRRLLEGINLLMCAYLAGESRNRPLARLFYDREDLLRAVFKDCYDTLLLAVFGPEPGRALLEAACSLFESGHLARAERAAQKALVQNPASLEAAELLDKITQVRQ